MGGCRKRNRVPWSAGRPGRGFSTDHCAECGSHARQVPCTPGQYRVTRDGMAAVGADGRAREGWAIMDTGALGRAAKRNAGKGIAIVAAGVAAAAVFTASASATNSGVEILRLTAKAAATVEITPCHTCVTSAPAGIHVGIVADQYGILVNGRGARVGHFVNWITQVTPSELLLDLTLVLGQGQVTAHGIEPFAASRGTIAITGGTGRYQSAGGEIRF